MNLTKPKGLPSTATESSRSTPRSRKPSIPSSRPSRGKKGIIGFVEPYRACRHCGIEFQSYAGKPGYLDECPDCLADRNNPPPRFHPHLWIYQKRTRTVFDTFFHSFKQILVGVIIIVLMIMIRLPQLLMIFVWDLPNMIRKTYRRLRQ